MIRALRAFQCFLNVKTKKSTNFIETQQLPITQFSHQQIATDLIRAGGKEGHYSMYYMVHTIDRIKLPKTKSIDNGMIKRRD